MLGDRSKGCGNPEIGGGERGPNGEKGDVGAPV